ncbi:MAG: histidine--tRNA ligase [Defluviicoccus sp.]|nr:histidine--tRNA ligase [Defluviicoccus sp.]MDG4591974.1 histidine--tRNA ligase [Defluviicoccus sp.]
MTALRPVRGTKDFLSEDSRKRRFVEDCAHDVAAGAGFAEIATPIFEFTHVFARTLGDTSDIVTKEMYTFQDRSGESLTLRPENTAGIVRAFLSNNLTQQLPLKVFYRGPMFRYERPQKGRLRQFHQIGVECLGAGTPIADVEVIALAADVLARLGLKDTVTLEINTLGDAESRSAYRNVLVDYLSARVESLSEDSRVRLQQNPLRILDSKDAGDRAVVAEAPSLEDHLSAPAQAFFAEVLAGLDALGIGYRVNRQLVRGLDYYCHTAFEFVSSALGAQGTVLAGGRYDELVRQMGGPPTPGIGWAAGVERLMMLAEGCPPAPRPIAVLPLGAAEACAALALARELRQAGLIAEFNAGGGLGKRMKWANRIDARVAVILGSDELARQVATVRNMDSGTQEDVALAELAGRLSQLS